MIISEDFTGPLATVSILISFMSIFLKTAKKAPSFLGYLTFGIMLVTDVLAINQKSVMIHYVFISGAIPAFLLFLTNKTSIAIAITII